MDKGGCSMKVILTEDVIKLAGIKDVKPNEEIDIDYKVLRNRQIRRFKIIAFCEDCGKQRELLASSFVNNCRKNKTYLCRDCSNIRKYGVKNVFQTQEVKKKRRNTLIEKYGVESPILNEDIKSKMQKTNIERYGAKCNFNNEDVREKRRKTCLEKYGVEEPLGSKEIQEKIEQTCLKRYGYKRAMMNSGVQEHNRQSFMKKYGVEFVGEIPEVKEKIKNTIKERYGVDNPIYVPEFKEKAILKRLENENDMLYNNIPTSSQQRYLHEIYGGEINKFVHGYFVDIMLTDNIYFEYDGSGHNLGVQMGKITEEQFKKRELFRQNLLESNGYKEFKIISFTDKLPDKSFLLELKDKAVEVLNSGYNYFIYNIETKETIIK